MSCTSSRPASRWLARPGRRSRSVPCRPRRGRKSGVPRRRRSPAALLRDGPDVLLEAPVAQVHEAVAEDHLAVVVAPDVRLDREIGQVAGRVEADELVRRVELHAAVGQRHQLALAPVHPVVLGGQVEPRHAPVGAWLMTASSRPETRDLGVRRVHGPVHPQRVVHAGCSRPPDSRRRCSSC